MRVDAPENTGSCARNRNPRAGAHRLGAGAEAGAHRLWQGLGRADPGRPLGGLPPSGRRREGPLGDTVCAAGGAPDISLRGPRRNVSITRAARTAAAFLSPPGSPAAGPSSQPLRAAAQALCANVTFPRAPPPPGRRAPGCQERGAARSELEGGPFISGPDRESDARADGRPGLVPARRLCATLAALLLFVPRRPCASSAGLSLSSMSLLSDSRIFSCPSPPGPVFPAFCPSPQMAFCSLPFLPLESRE